MATCFCVFGRRRINGWPNGLRFPIGEKLWIFSRVLTRIVKQFATPVRRKHEVVRHLRKTCESYRFNETGWHPRSFADLEWKAAARSAFARYLSVGFRNLKVTPARRPPASSATM